MASKCFSISGLLVSATVFLLAFIFMILTITRSAPSESTETHEETEIVYTPVQTRATFNQTDYQNQTTLVLSKESVNKWGTVPGDFESTYTMEVTIQLFSSSNDFSDGPMVTSEGSVEVEVNPTFAWADLVEGTTEYRCTGCMMKTISAVPTYAIDDTQKTSLQAQIVETLNYGALSSWYKLQNAPIYKKACQVWNQITDKMFNQSFQSFYYAFYCFNSQESSNTDYYNFSVQSSVETMLTSLTTNPFSAADATAIYTENQYGMSSYKDLTYWVNACLTARSAISGSGAGSESYNVLILHFAEIGIDISDAQMDEIVGSGSVMLSMVDTLEARLVQYGPSKANYDFLSAPIKANPLAMTQWSQGTLLGNVLDFWLTGENSAQLISFKDITSMKDLGMNFNVPPELSPAGQIEVNTALELSYNGAISGTYSLNDPMRMYLAWLLHATTDPPIFSAKTDEKQSQQIVDWFTEQLTYNVEQAQGTFISKNVESAQNFLIKNFTAEAAARNFGYQINYLATVTQDCSYFLTPVLGTGTADFCESWDFSNLNTLRMFVDGTMKGGDYLTAVEDLTLLTSSQLETLYSTTSTTGTPTGTFGDVLLYINQLMSTTWVCAGASETPVVECTGAELAPYQWGAAYYTRNPIFTSLVASNGFLVNTAYSMCSWTGASYPGCEFPPEYAAYQNQPYTYAQNYLTEDQAMKIMDNSYSWYGLKNIYNSMMLFADYEIVKKDWISPSQYWYDTAAYYDMTSDQLKTVLKYLEWQSLEWLTGGYTMQISKWDLLYGFKSDFNEKINTGSVRSGDLHIDDEVTPLLNLWMGPTANRRITFFQGERQLDEGETEPYENAQFWPQDAGAVREIDNDGASIWLTQQLWTGAEWEPVSWYNEKVGRTYLYDANAGITGLSSMKLPIKNSLNLTSNSYLQGFALESFSEFAQIFQFETDRCQTPDNAGETCYQEFAELNFKEFTEPGALNYIDDALNMPVEISNIQSQQFIDQAQGWTTQFINLYDLTLKGGSRFFTSDTDDTDVAIASIATRVQVDETAYMNNANPLNGTTQWATGEQTVDVTTTTLDPRKAGEKVGIAALTILTFVGLVMIIIFAKLLAETGSAANKVAYPTTGGDSDRLI